VARQRGRTRHLWVEKISEALVVSPNNNSHLVTEFFYLEEGQPLAGDPYHMKGEKEKETTN